MGASFLSRNVGAWRDSSFPPSLRKLYCTRRDSSDPSLGSSSVTRVLRATDKALDRAKVFRSPSDERHASGDIEKESRAQEFELITTRTRGAETRTKGRPDRSVDSAKSRIDNDTDDSRALYERPSIDTLTIPSAPQRPTSKSSTPIRSQILGAKPTSATKS